MTLENAWGDDLIASFDPGLESFNMGPEFDAKYPNFKPINIVVENGIYYVTIYVCGVPPRSDRLQELLIWFASLKETDFVKLNVASMIMDIPVSFLLPLLGAIVRTKATIEIQLDTIVCDTLAYFYLAADKIKAGVSGALYIPSHLDTPKDEKSSAWVVVHDFIQELISKAQETGLLTSKDAEMLLDTRPVVVNPDRFSKV